MNIYIYNNRFTLLLCLLYTGLILGQNIQLPIGLKSPNANSLGKFGDIPINYYTGRANINIPLINLQDNNIPLKIDLSYDTGGVRVNEFPSWIGQNWNLNAGGVITRTVKGYSFDEEDRIFGYTGNNDIRGYYYQHNHINTSDWSSNAAMMNNALSYTPSRDLEPDIFNFNFMGINGKFFLGEDGQWKVQSDKNIKVEINMLENQLTLNRDIFYQHRSFEGYNGPDRKTIFKITLIDDQGNKYIFGNNHNAIEYTTANFFYYRGGFCVLPNSWYLTSVIDRLGNIIYNFEYERAEYQASFYLTYSSITREKSNNGTFWQPGGGCFYSEFSPLRVNGSLIIPSYLKKITTLNGTEINFNRSISSNKYFYPAYNSLLNYTLDTYYYENPSTVTFTDLYTRFGIIYYDQYWSLLPSTPNTSYKDDLFNNKIKNYKLDNITIKINSNLYKTINLNHNSSLNERLNLVGVSIFEGNSTSSSDYSFLYNNFSLLPDYLSTAIDHWGFYKGGSGFTTSNYSNHYFEREPNPAFLQIGSLKKIIYPTKGFTEFEYEPHDYSKFVNENLNLQDEVNIAGGLRVKKIHTFDGISKTTKEIKYVTDLTSNISSGILAMKNKYNWPTWQTRTWPENSLYQEANFSINAIIPHNNFSGSHIAYSKVYEINNSDNGYTTYEYTNYQDYPDIPYVNTLNVQQSQFNEHSRKDFKRGLEKKISFYNNQNSLIKKIENTYNTINYKTARGYNYDQFMPCPGVGDVVVIGNTYEIEYSDFKLTSSIETDYLNGNAISKTSTQTNVVYPNDATFYGNTFLRSETVQTNRSGGTKTIQYNYPFDFTGTIESNMISKHFFPAIETITSRFGDPITRNKNIYQLVATNTTFPTQTYPMITSTQAAKNQDTYQTDIVIDKYDKDGNILQYHKDGGINNSFVFSNNLLMYKLENATWNEYTPTTNFATFNSNPAKKATKYSYNIYRNIESITHPNGIIEKYQYDINNRLEKILDQNDKVLKKFEYNLK